MIATPEASLQNSFYSFSLNPASASWSLTSNTGELQEARLRLDYRLGNACFTALDIFHSPELTGPSLIASPHGPLQQLELRLPPDPRGLACRVTFALPTNSPLFLWRLSVENRGAQPVSLERLSLLNVARFPGLEPFQSPAFFSNGWGSWNYTGAYAASDCYRRTRLGSLSMPLRGSGRTPQPKPAGHFASDFFGVLGDRSSRRLLLIGFLSQRQHFGVVEAWLGEIPRLQLWADGDGARLDPGAEIQTDWACLAFLDLDSPDPLGRYFDAVGAEYGVLQSALSNQPATESTSTGWCSWYQYYSKITPEILRRNLQTAARLRSDMPLDLFQIDDGFERKVGDWFEFSPAFPRGVAPLAQEIRQAGFTPGLWLAPFILDPHSNTARQHPEWLLRGRFNRPVNAGFLFSGFFSTALDLTHPGALEHVQSVIHTAAHDWGFPYLKLDFLYAAALPGKRRDPRLTRAQALRHGLQAVRDAAGPETFLLGCGCPLGPAIGLVDAMRIGADVDGRWRPAYKGITPFFRHEPDMPSARNAIQNTLTRAGLHRRWWLNDPDCLLLRPDLLLSEAEVRSLAAVIALSGGLLLLSDDLSALPPERLRLAQTLLPSIGLRPLVLDWFDAAIPARLRLDLSGPIGEWRLLALFNWQDAPQDLSLRLADYGLDPTQVWWAREFWSGRVFQISGGEQVFPATPPHGGVLLALHLCLPAHPQYLGSDLHISQGLEVAAWEASPGRLRLQLQRPGRASGEICLALPSAPQQALLAGASIPWHPGQVPGSYLFPVTFTHQANLEIHFSPTP